MGKREKKIFGEDRYREEDGPDVVICCNVVMIRRLGVKLIFVNSEVVLLLLQNLPKI